MQDTRPDNGEPIRNHNVLILQEGLQHQNLMKVNRYLFYMVLSLMAVVFVMGLFWPTKDPLIGLQNNAAIPLANNQLALSAEINTLKGQVAGLVSGSIESKLRSLEESIRSGSVNNALGTIQDLKRDLQVLQSQSDPSSALPVSKPANTEALVEEVSHLKHLIYLTLASGSLMFAAFAGVWINKRYRLTYRKKAFLQNHSK